MSLGLAGYFTHLSKGRTALWCYAIWYGVNVAMHFDPNPRLWLTSVGLSAIIGIALILSTRANGRGMQADGWTTFRLFLMPFCVSSFAALVKDAGYILVFPPSLRENAVGFGAIGVFLLSITLLRRCARESGTARHQ